MLVSWLGVAHIAGHDAWDKGDSAWPAQLAVRITTSVGSSLRKSAWLCELT